MGITENIVTWGELPTRKRSTGRPLGARRHMQLEVLKSRPGRWALLDTYEKQGNATSGGATLKKHGFEVATRKNDEGQYGLWARWTGENKEN